MDKATTEPFGILAKFESPEALISAAKKAVGAGYRKFDTFSPFPLEGMSEAMRLRPSWLPYLVLLGGIGGAVTGVGMQVYSMVIDQPLNIGGRPLMSWPVFIPIAFELTILLSAVAGIAGLFLVTRFPQPYHPVFNVEDFRKHGSMDGFYLMIENRDPLFHLPDTTRLLESWGAIQVNEIEE